MVGKIDHSTRTIGPSSVAAEGIETTNILTKDEIERKIGTFGSLKTITEAQGTIIVNRRNRELKTIM